MSIKKRLKCQYLKVKILYQNNIYTITINNGIYIIFTNQKRTYKDYLTQNLFQISVCILMADWINQRFIGN